MLSPCGEAAVWGAVSSLPHNIALGRGVYRQLPVLNGLFHIVILFFPCKQHKLTHIHKTPHYFHSSVSWSRHFFDISIVSFSLREIWLRHSSVRKPESVPSKCAGSVGAPRVHCWHPQVLMGKTQEGEDGCGRRGRRGSDKVKRERKKRKTVYGADTSVTWAKLFWDKHVGDLAPSTQRRHEAGRQPGGQKKGNRQSALEFIVQPICF